METKTSKTILRFMVLSGALILSCCDVPVEYNNPFDPSVAILPPSKLTIDSVSETSVSLSWKNNISVADPYKLSLLRTVVEYAFQKDSKGKYIFQPIDTVSGSTSSITVVRRFEQADFHAFAVYNILGSRPTELSNVVGTNLYTQPLAPSNIALGFVGPNDCEMIWKDNSSSELGFEIERRVGASGNYAKIAQVPANARRFDDTTVINFAGDTLFYRLRAVLSYGRFSPYSSASIYYPFAPPASLMARTRNRTSVHLTWISSVLLGSGFVVERAENAGSFVEIGRVSFFNSGYIDSPPDTSMEYSYRIRLYTGNRQSDPSGSVLVGWWPNLVNGSATSLQTCGPMGISPDKSLIFVIGFPADINVVASSTFQTYRRFQNTGNWVNSVDIDKDNQFVAAGLTDSLQNSGKVRIWRLSDGSLFKEWKKPEPVHTVKFSPDGSFLATDGDTGSIQFLDFREDRTLRTVPGYSPIAFSTPSSEEPQTLIAARASQRQVQVWNMSGSVWGGVDLGANVNNVSNLKFFRKGRPLLVVFDNSIVLADIYGSYPPRKYPGTLCEITADDQFMVGSSNYGLFVICVSSWSVTSIVPSEFPYQMALLSDGRVLFSEDQGLKQYYLQNRWTSPLVDPNAGWMPNRTTLLRGSRSHR